MALPASFSLLKASFEAFARHARDVNGMFVPLCFFNDDGLCGHSFLKASLVLLPLPCLKLPLVVLSFLCFVLVFALVCPVAVSVAAIACLFVADALPLS